MRDEKFYFHFYFILLYGKKKQKKLLFIHYIFVRLFTERSNNVKN